MSDESEKEETQTGASTVKASKPGESKVKVGDLIWYEKEQKTLSLVVELTITHECGDDGLHLIKVWRLENQTLYPFYVYPDRPGKWSIVNQQDL